MTETRDAPTGNTPRARVDVTTWTYYPEPPSVVDAGLDRLANRWFTTARIVQWTTGVFFLLAVFPALLFGIVFLPPPVLITASVVGVAGSLGAALRHQHLRRRTGMPVIPVLEDTLESTAAMLGSYREAFELTLQDDTAEEMAHYGDENVRSLQRSARSALKAQRKMARHFITHLELAAQADRRGWKWLRDRHARTIAGMVLQVTSPTVNNTEVEEPT